MKIGLLLLGSLVTGLLVGCNALCNTGGDCGYVTHSSQCGLPSCTNNASIVEYSNPCPGPYDCPDDP